MIRPFTVLCLLAACGSGLFLYSEKHRTELLDREIGGVIRATQAARARSGVLRAEWALLNEPGRLQDMAGRYLSLHPMVPTQFVPVTELAAHLPAPVTQPDPAEVDEDDAPVAAPVATLASGSPAQPVAAQAVATAATVPPTSPDTRTAPKLLASSAHPNAVRHVTLAGRRDLPAHEGLLTRGTPLPLAAPQPMGARVYSAMARPLRVSSTRPAIVAAVPSYAPARSYIPSALGGGTALPPPIPYGR